METKPFYLSKTFYFNALTILIVVASAYGYVPNQELSQQVATYLLLISPLVNLILRFITKQPISFTTQ